MPTIPAYERDPYRRRLDTEVVEIGAGDDGPWAVLDDTILYPEGGGQPADRGRIGGVGVVDVERRGNRIRHRLEAPVRPGPAVVELDWERRYDHMQQHTAQHLLSAVAHERHGWETTSFHLGAAVCDVELATPAIGSLEALEEAVAAEVRAARPVRAHRFEPQDVDLLAVRSRGLPRGHTGSVRVVEIEGIDRTTCGGTHLASTAEIETVQLLAAEPLRGGTRLSWVAGARVRRRLAGREALVRELGRLFDTADHELAALAAARLEELRAAERVARRLTERWAAAEAARLSGAGGSVVEAHFDDAGGGLLRRIAAGLALDGRRAALLTAERQGTAFFLLAVADSAGLDAQALGRRLAECLDGRGGGSGALFQGKAGSLERRDQALAELREAVGTARRAAR